ncbi:MAG: hypothetical protein MJY49_05550, partial [Bacteroidales bacterium]|nr:hypothetical protein [Bacteroidales bacterium]
MNRIAFVTLGCKLNYAETSTYERSLVEAGWTVVPWTDASADLFLVNTCSVTEHSDKKSRNIIRKLHRVAPHAGIIVTGCSAQLRRQDIEGLEGVVRVFGASEKSQVVPFILGAAGGYPSEVWYPPADRGTAGGSLGAHRASGGRGYSDECIEDLKGPG